MKSPEELDRPLAQIDEEQLNAVVDRLCSDPRALAHVVASIAPDDIRHDG